MLKITVISDTHGEHEKLGRLSGEVLIHCGDMFNLFGQSHAEFERMDAWFGQQEFDRVICIGGNHDFELQKRGLYTDTPFRNAVYLEGRALQYGGINFYGAPWVPDLMGQAFFTPDEDLPAKWAEIPPEVDVLITHTPPAGILDVSSRGLELGCPHLARELRRCRPSLHCFGHVHASSGVQRQGDATYINAAQVNSQYQLVRQPYVIDI